MSYDKLTPKLMLQLAAPHTWPAAIVPVLVACAIAIAHKGSVSIIMVLALTLISILFQAAANTFNDFFDFVKGTDSASDNVEESDATLVYNNLNLPDVKRLGFAFLIAAFVLGIFVIVRGGWIPLVIAVIGAAVTVFYSAGKTPVSSLPIGEFVSGFVMGGLILMASYTALTGEFTWATLVWGIPPIIGIGLILMTNNTCDIEKDTQARRKTMPLLIGRRKARVVYKLLVLAWLLSIVVVIWVDFTGGLVLVPALLVLMYPILRGLLSNPLTPQARVGAMAQILSVNVSLGALYAVCILASVAQLTVI